MWERVKKKMDDSIKIKEKSVERERRKNVKRKMRRMCNMTKNKRKELKGTLRTEYLLKKKKLETEGRM